MTLNEEMHDNFFFFFELTNYYLLCIDIKIRKAWEYTLKNSYEKDI